jgi:hypothetical protein
MTHYFYAGPSILKSQIESLFPHAGILPPVKQGDIYRLVSHEKNIESISIIDGYFENVPAVMHKEILYAISSGYKVFGSSSMGALRASELSRFGMIGIGEVYSLFESGTLNDDDEVTVAHADAKLEYKPLSTALVNMRFTLQNATQEGVVSETFQANFLKEAKSLFYKERTYHKVIEKLKGNQSLEKTIKLFNKWLLDNEVNIKHQDAIQLINTVKHGLEKPKQIFNPHIFQDSTLWRKALNI